MTTDFGCARCHGDDAQAALAHIRDQGLPIDRFLVDDSHFIVSLRHCRECRQRFVSIFTEDVDWVGGDDAQYRQVVPITPEEAATLAAQGENVDLRHLGSLGEGRRYLSTSWPTGGEEWVGWGHGFFWVREGR
jgi:hypothetical protein